MTNVSKQLSVSMTFHALANTDSSQPEPSRLLHSCRRSPGLVCCSAGTRPSAGRAPVPLPSAGSRCTASWLWWRPRGAPRTAPEAASSAAWPDAGPASASPPRWMPAPAWPWSVVIHRPSDGRSAIAARTIAGPARHSQLAGRRAKRGLRAAGGRGTQRSVAGPARHSRLAGRRAERGLPAAGGRGTQRLVAGPARHSRLTGKRDERVSQLPGDYNMCGVTTPALLKTAGVGLRRNFDISASFFLKRTHFCNFQHFPNKLTEIRGETKF